MSTKHSVQPADIGWPTGNRKKLSCCQAQLSQATCLAVAYLLSISSRPSYVRRLYNGSKEGLPSFTSVILCSQTARALQATRKKWQVPYGPKSVIWAMWRVSVGARKMKPLPGKPMDSKTALPCRWVLLAENSTLQETFYHWLTFETFDCRLTWK